MALPNYYVGTTLSDIGRQMQGDRENDTRLELGRAEQQRLQQAALMQHLYQQQAQQQQQNQFVQELALRKQAQDQQAQYQNSLLGLKQNEFDFSKNGTTPGMEWDNNYRNAALLNQLEVAKINAGRNDPTVAAMRVRQEAETQRDAALALENWQAETSAAQAKAAEYNALASQIETEAQRLQATGKEWFTSQGTADEKARQQRAKFQQLIEALRADTRPGQISPTHDGKFQPVVRPRPALPQSMGSPNGFNPTARFDSEAGIPAPVAGARVDTSPVADKPIRIQNSRGQQFTILSSQYPIAKQRDPGVQIVSASAPAGIPSRAALMGSTGPGGAPPAPVAPQRPGLMGALYNNAKGYYGDILNRGQTAAGNALGDVVAPVYNGANDYYQQLLDMLNQPYQNQQ